MSKTINLALQGGGAHGAFTWGVLETLAADERLSFKTISGTSAGAMNGAVFIYGMISGGRKKAIELLETFWRRVSQSGRFGIFTGSNMAEKLFGPMAGTLAGPLAGMATGAYMGFDMLSKMFSPYQFNPLGVNPLRDILLDIIDFKKLAATLDYNLHISATDVLDSRLKIFTGEEISVDALLASSCLPQLFQAVEINGRYYWDGGFMGNPTLFPLTQCEASNDLLIVRIDPFKRPGLPTTPDGIADRLNEISFNSPLLVELRGLHLINQLLREGHLNALDSGMRHLHIHMVADDSTMAALPLESKFNPDWDFLLTLREAGQKAAKAWLVAHYAAIGETSSLDLGELLA